MADPKNDSIFNKIIKAGETALDGYINKAQANAQQETYWSRKGLTEVEYATEQQAGWKEKRGLIGPGVLRNMARKDSVIMSIINTRISQVNAFAQPQKDKYSPGFKIVPKEQADFTPEEKLKMSDPELEEEEREKLHHKAEKRRSKATDKQKKDIETIKDFILHCGVDPSEYDTTHKRIDFDKYIKLITWDRLVYNYSATELIPTKDGDSLSCFYPVSSGTIRFVSKRSAGLYQKTIKEQMLRQKKDDEHEGKKIFEDPKNPYKYVQVVRGRVVAAWSEREMIFEPANPTTDPEDYGYGTGELETLIQIVTAHLFAEAHNRNFFTQGIGSKGLLHIKGDTINRAQLEAFKRQWFNQLSNSRNAFRPPIIGMADEVKWIPLAQTNREMEFEQWMHYLIKISCAVYQIDPAEINFDISKLQTSTLNEASNEQRLKQSRDKGLRPLLDYLENIINRHILPYWNKDLAAKYEFKFVGLESETRMQEVERLREETAVWKTINEARVEMGAPPIEDGDIVRDASFMQFKQAKMTQEQEAMMPAEEEESPVEEMDNEEPMMKEELDGLTSDLDAIERDVEADAKQAEKDAADEAKAKENNGKASKEESQEKAAKESVKKKGAKKEDKVEKANKKEEPSVIEYYIEKDEDE